MFGCAAGEGEVGCNAPYTDRSRKLVKSIVRRKYLARRARRGRNIVSAAVSSFFNLPCNFLCTVSHLYQLLFTSHAVLTFLF